MAPTLSVQLCLGLCLCWGIWAQEGPLPRPSLRAEPDFVIPWGKPVTLWCEGPPGADRFLLRKEGVDLIMDKSADGRGAQVLITNMTAETAGTYQCCYMNQSWLSEASDPLELIVTGRYHSPSLSALPSSQVASGQEVTLQCQSQLRYSRFALYKHGEQITYGVTQFNGQGAQTNFSIPAVTPAHGGSYRCYSFFSHKPYVWSVPSDPLVLRVTGPLPRPSLRAEPGLVVPQGKPVTLRCEGPPGADLYRLWKEAVDLDMETSADGRGGQVLISNMGAETAGRYQCLYMNQSLWSQASDALALRVAGPDKPPSLSSLPSSQVASGQNVTLQCQSQLGYDSSALYKDGGEITYRGTQDNGQGSQTNFSFPTVTPAHGGTYQCYSFHSNNPYVWSAPSDPLVLRVTGPGTSKDPHLTESPEDPQALTSFPPSEQPVTFTTNAAPLDYTVGCVLRLLLAQLALTILGILLIQA